MARRLCELCGKRAVGTGKSSGYEDREYCISRKWCIPCGDESQHEIAHDNGHENISEDDCWLCHPEKNEAAKEYTARVGHTNTAAKSRESHAGCTHERTPAGRARCRKVRAEHGVPIAVAYDYTPRCTCGDDPRDGKVLIHSHKCPLKGTTTEETAPVVTPTPTPAKRPARGKREATVTDVASLPMPKLTGAQLASPIIQSMLRK